MKPVHGGKTMSRKKLSRNAPCPCGSGKKYKHCCYGKDIEDDLGLGSGQPPPKYPIGTVALYGPDDKTTTKIAAGVILHDGAKAIIKRWVATDVTTNPKVQQEMKDFFLQHGVKQVAMTEGNMGCLHRLSPRRGLPVLSVLEGKTGEQGDGRVSLVVLPWKAIQSIFWALTCRLTETRSATPAGEIHATDPGIGQDD
jgi:hypothetical protein